MPVDGLDKETFQTVAKILKADTEDFNALVRLAGLDPRRDFRSVDLSEMSLAGADLRGFDFSYSDFRNVDVEGAWIAGAVFEGADLAGTDLLTAHGFEEADCKLAVIQDEPFAPELVVIPPGSFLMGSRPDEAERNDSEGPRHEVRIAQRFALGRYPVTFEEYDRFTAATGREQAKDAGWGRGRRPVIGVSWEDAQAYVAWLSEETGRPYRLPSEAEWEYACRAGTATPYAWGDEITPEGANCDDNVGQTTEVGSYPPNPWGLYDMHGNVWEWCGDIWHESYEGAPTDGSAWLEGGDQGRRVLRGGSWSNPIPRVLRSAIRLRFEPDHRRDSPRFPGRQDAP